MTKKAATGWRANSRRMIERGAGCCVAVDVDIISFLFSHSGLTTSINRRAKHAQLHALVGCAKVGLATFQGFNGGARLSSPAVPLACAIGLPPWWISKSPTKVLIIPSPKLPYSRPVALKVMGAAPRG